MTARPGSRRHHRLAVLVATTTAAAGLAACTSGPSTREDSAPTGSTAEQVAPRTLERLVTAAYRVGIAADLWWRSEEAINQPYPAELDPDLLARAGVSLPDGVAYREWSRSADAEGTLTPLPGGPDDSWHVCLVADDGSWLTYGDASGVQRFGTGDEAACTFGAPDVDLQDRAGFDPRVFAQAAHDAFDEREVVVTFDAAQQERLGVLLTDGWHAVDVSKDGVADPLQYCLVRGPEWVYVETHGAADYGTSGRCTYRDLPPSV